MDQEVQRISVQELKEKLDNNEDVVVLDVRSHSSWEGATEMIPGAIRIEPDEISQYLNMIPPAKLIVTYCT